MSLLSFTKCFIGAGGEQAAAALTTAMVKMSPEAATAAELKNMEQDLDAAGRLISQLQRDSPMNATCTMPSTPIILR